MSMDNNEIGRASVMTPRLIVGVAIALFGVVLVLDRLNLVVADQVLRVVAGGHRRHRRGDLHSVPPDRQRRQRRHRHARRRLAPAEHARHRAGALLGDVLADGPDWHRLRAGDAGDATPHQDGLGRGPDATLAVFAVMSGVKRISTAHRFRGGEITAVMGGAQLDLRQATIPPGEEAALDIFAVMGGCEIIVPSSWTVVTPLVPIMGGDRRQAAGASAGWRREHRRQAGSAPRAARAGLDGRHRDQELDASDPRSPRAPGQLPGSVVRDRRSRRRRC